MAANIRSFDELAKVLVHELGHIVDIYYLQRSGITRDLSHTYYEISWEDVDTQKSGASSSDFISWYATTNQYEDFAEAFTFFLFHNEEFLRRSQESWALQKKYDFLRGHVFGDYYQWSSFEKDPIPSYIWDTTKVGLKEWSREKAF